MILKRPTYSRSLSPKSTCMMTTSHKKGNCHGRETTDNTCDDVVFPLGSESLNLVFYRCRPSAERRSHACDV